MGLFNIFKGKKKEVSDTNRKEFLLKHGRITEGTIIDSDTTPNGDEIVYYFYTINGVDFESSDILNEKQKQDPLKYAPGAKVSIRFDQKNHGNSVLD
ncbi:MAG TPA: hypothetical protein VIL74_21420 [Pyrinomonadaceae bacterium]|jgi:hypothetical protein